MRYNYQLHHVIIAQFCTLILLWIGLNVFSFVAPALFYTIREVWQYNNGVRHEERFDWGGCIPVIISQTIIGLIYAI